MSRSVQLLPLIPIILLGFSLRIHDLQAVPLRGDEAFSAMYWADLPLSQSLSDIAPIDPHPPLAYGLVRFWRQVISDIEPVFALRHFSVLGNIIGIPALFGLGWRLSGSRMIGMLAALIWALHPYEIWHSQDFRNYAIWAGLSVTSLWLGLRVIDGGRRKDWRLYCLVATCAALTFYTELFMLLALSCFAILSRRNDRRFLQRFLALQLGIVAVVIFGFLILQAQEIFAGNYGGNLQAFAASDYLTRFIPTLIAGETIPTEHSLVGLILTVICIPAALLIYQSSTRAFQFVFVLSVLPLLLLGLVAQRLNVFNPRYVLATIPAFVLLLVLGSFHLAGRAHTSFKVSRSLLTLVILLPWIAMAAAANHAYFNAPRFRKAPAWDELGEFLNARVDAGDFVIQQSVDPAFAYYYDGAAPETALPASSSQTADDIIAEISRISETSTSVYVVSTVQAGWPNDGVVVDWMRSNLQEVLLTDVSGLPVRQYKPWSQPDDSEAELARFDDLVVLARSEFAAEPLPTGELLLWLYWKPLATTPRSLKSFVHVYGAVNPATGSVLWTQDDQYPQEGRLDSASWPINDVYRDVYYLPGENLAAGEYQIHIGWYDPETGKRLSIGDDNDSYDTISFNILGPTGASK